MADTSTDAPGVDKTTIATAVADGIATAFKALASEADTPAEPAQPQAQAPAVVTKPAEQNLAAIDPSQLSEVIENALKEGGLAQMQATMQRLEAQAGSQKGAYDRVEAAAMSRRHAVKEDEGVKGRKLAQMVRCMAFPRVYGSLGMTPQQAAVQLYGETHPVMDVLTESLKLSAGAISSSSGSGGGAWIPGAVSQDFIEILRPLSIYEQAGPNRVSLDRGTLDIRKQTAGAVASYSTELRAAEATRASTGKITLVSKKLAATTRMSNDWIRRADPGTDQMIVDDLAAAVAQAKDLAMIRSDGMNGEPRGWRHMAAPSNIVGFSDLTGTQAEQAQQVGSQLGDLTLRLREADVPLLRPLFVWAPRTDEFLEELRDGNGNLVYGAQRARGLMKGAPYLVSNQIPTNISSNQSEIYFLDMAQIIYGEETAMLVDIFTEGSLTDGSGVVSLIDEDSTAVRVISNHDQVARHDTAIAVGTTVTWGA